MKKIIRRIVLWSLSEEVEHSHNTDQSIERLYEWFSKLLDHFNLEIGTKKAEEQEYFIRKIKVLKERVEQLECPEEFVDNTHFRQGFYRAIDDVIKVLKESV